jgi:hypothetical protein
MSYGNGPPFGGPPGGPRPPGDPGPPPGYGAPLGVYGAGNPYQAPAAQNHTRVGALGPPGAGLKWLYMGGYAGYWLLTVVGILLAVVLPDETRQPVVGATMASTLPLAGVLLLIAGLIGAAVWLYKAWESVPESMRYTSRGRWITPGKAVGHLFVPFYNLYWMFVVAQGLCEALDRTLLAQGAPPRAPRGLATAACTAQIIPYCNLLVAPILWAVYMFQVDGARREMMRPPG